jgi:hypothetical protein
MYEPIIQYAVEHPEQVAGAATAVGASAFHYTRTGSLPLGRLPWRTVRDIVGELGDQYFGRSRPAGVPAILVDADIEAVETALRDVHFEGADLISYEYAGEVLNLRRPAGTKRHPDTGREIPMELHVRAFQTQSRGHLLLAHYEASRYEAQGIHLRETMLSWETGQGMLASTLHNETGLDHEKVASERDAGVEVVS